MHIVCALIRFCSFLNLYCDIIVPTTPAYLTTLHVIHYAINGFEMVPSFYYRKTFEIFMKSANFLGVSEKRTGGALVVSSYDDQKLFGSNRPFSNGQ